MEVWKLGAWSSNRESRLIGPDPDTRCIYFWNPHKKHYKSALGIVSRSALPAKRWTRVGAALISQLADIERGRDEVLIRGSMVTPVCAHAGFDSMGCGCKSACCKRINRVTGHLWTGVPGVRTVCASSLRLLLEGSGSGQPYISRKNKIIKAVVILK